MSRYDIEKFDSPPDPDLVCCICQCVLDKAVECPCRHVFCQACIERWLSSRPTCPTCRTRTRKQDLKPVLPLVQNMINRLMMLCDFRDNGCLEKIMLEYYDRHISTCGYEMKTCRFSKCGRQILRRDLEEHESSLCEHRERVCQGQCGLMVALSDQASHNCVVALKENIDEKNHMIEILKAKLQELNNLSQSLKDQLEQLRQQLNDRPPRLQNLFDAISDTSSLSDGEVFMSDYDISEDSFPDTLSEHSDDEESINQNNNNSGEGNDRTSAATTGRQGDGSNEDGSDVVEQVRRTVMNSLLELSSRLERVRNQMRAVLNSGLAQEQAAGNTNDNVRNPAVAVDNVQSNSDRTSAPRHRIVLHDSPERNEGDNDSEADENNDVDTDEIPTDVENNDVDTDEIPTDVERDESDYHSDEHHEETDRSMSSPEPSHRSLTSPGRTSSRSPLDWSPMNTDVDDDDEDNHSNNASMSVSNHVIVTQPPESPTASWSSDNSSSIPTISSPVLTARSRASTSPPSSPVSLVSSSSLSSSQRSSSSLSPSYTNRSSTPHHSESNHPDSNPASPRISSVSSPSNGPEDEWELDYESDGDNLDSDGNHNELKSDATDGHSNPIEISSEVSENQNHNNSDDCSRHSEESTHSERLKMYATSDNVQSNDDSVDSEGADLDSAVDAPLRSNHSEDSDQEYVNHNSPVFRPMENKSDNNDHTGAKGIQQNSAIEEYDPRYPSFGKWSPQRSRRSAPATPTYQHGSSSNINRCEPDSTQLIPNSSSPKEGSQTKTQSPYSHRRRIKRERVSVSTSDSDDSDTMKYLTKRKRRSNDMQVENGAAGYSNDMETASSKRYKFRKRRHDDDSCSEINSKHGRYDDRYYARPYPDTKLSSFKEKEDQKENGQSGKRSFNRFNMPHKRSSTVQSDSMQESNAQSLKLKIDLSVINYSGPLASESSSTLPSATFVRSSANITPSQFHTSSRHHSVQQSFKGHTHKVSETNSGSSNRRHNSSPGHKAESRRSRNANHSPSPNAGSANNTCGNNQNSTNESFEESDSSSDGTWEPCSEAEASDDTVTDGEEFETDTSYEVRVPKSTATLLEEYASDSSDDSWTVEMSQ
ncbi:serine-aspartate repeat-containing protein F-like [Dreissena polymorpha]|uniref:RING-type domain-containing protein n=1 Tax=Dreissena polymorpha TaxID=45954 RepID=A0A9D4LTX4_DREPO|nr:serine-aspartate repeat-containing protein F-like [Dreissena polymorpha]XP_052263255.1 serine-aspartate repeat-containing protein F-like [Dreissena polymorpha]KAH3863703.1 hypothetical protein DPMN_026693 [Dreissena polymorpha]